MFLRTSQAVQWLRSSSEAAVGSILGWEAKIPHASWPKKLEHKQLKQYCNKLSKDLKKCSIFPPTKKILVDKEKWDISLALEELPLL